MSNTERQGNPQETFSFEGQTIGGPKNYWKPIQNYENKPIINAWEFLNIRNSEGSIPGYNFKFPKGTLADIYLELAGNPTIFTIMGGEKASLDSSWHVTKAQLYFRSNEWEADHQNQWALWKYEGTDLERSKLWSDIGFIPKEAQPTEEPQTGKSDSDHYPINLKKLGVAAAVVLSVATIGLLLEKKTNPDNLSNTGSPAPTLIANNETFTPVPTQSVTEKPIIITPKPTVVVPTPTQNIQPPYESYPIAKGATKTVAAGSIITGDVYINGQQYMDNLNYTGLIVHLDQEASITAPSGASVQDNINMDLNQLEQQDKTAMESSGCVGNAGCSQVDIINYPSGNPQGQ